MKSGDIRERGDSVDFVADCPICAQQQRFAATNDWGACRGELQAKDCPFNSCTTRERALAHVLLSLWDRQTLFTLSIHEAAPAIRGISLLLKQNAENYVATGYFPGLASGQLVKGLRNEDLERQTISDWSFDLVIHLDVLEHLFDPFAALGEIFRTLKPGGKCIFTVPTYGNRFTSSQVAFREEAGKLRVIGEPEYHGNPQNPDGRSIVTWRYGYDLPILISRKTGFDVEVRRWQSRRDTIMGPMNEVYILTRPD